MSGEGPLTPERARLVERMIAAGLVLGAMAAGGAGAIPRAPEGLAPRLHVRVEGAVARPGRYSLPLGTDSAALTRAASPRFPAAAPAPGWALEEGDVLYVDREGRAYRNPWR